MKKLLSLFAAVALLGFAAATSAQDLDVVHAGGAGERGTVTKTTPTEVELNKAGAAQTFPVNEIKLITFGDDPRELTEARNHIKAGRLEDALTGLKKIDLATISRGIVKQDVQFYTALAQSKLALAGTGDKRAAATEMLDFYQNNTGSFHRLEAAQVLGDLAMAIANHKAASTFYAEISKAPWPDYKLRGSVLEARALLAQGQFDDAIKRYDEVIASAAANPAALRQKQLASVFRALCLAELGKPAEGLAIVDDIISKNDAKDTELFANVYNVRGACHLKLDKKKEAILDYLHVDLLFFRESDAHAEALYHLGKLWSEVNKNERAIEARTKLKDAYPGSLWASKS